MNTKKYIKSLSAFFTSAVMLCNLSAAVCGEDVSSEENIERNINVTLGDIGYAPAEIMSNADSGFLFYDQLNGNNKASYQAIEEYVSDPSDTTLTVVLDEPIVLARSSRTISKWTDEEYMEYADAVIDAVMPGIIACTLDYPELFWLNFAEIGCGKTDSGTTYAAGTTAKWDIYINEIAVTPAYDTNYTSFDQVLEIREHVLQAVEDYEITGDTDYEKCKSIYQSIIDSTNYDTAAPYAHGIAGVLYDTSAVCEGFAKTFKILCDRENIPCLSILGNYNPEIATAHMWNYVYLDDKWYACDVTFDESTGNMSYFMRGSDTFNLNHTPESPYSIIELSFPEISSEDYIVSGTSDTTTTTITNSSTTTATTTTTTTSSTTATTTTTTTASSTTAATSTTISEIISTESETTAVSTVSDSETATTTKTTSFETSTIKSETTTSKTNTTSQTTTSVTTASSSLSSTTHTEKPDDLKGDVNQDGTVSIADAVLLRKYILGIKKSSDIELSLADCDENMRINIFDVCILMNILLNL